MRLLASFMLAATFVATPVFADTFDRINDCERGGGGACVFQILRELASRSGPQGPLELRAGTYRLPSGWSHQIAPTGPRRFTLSWSGGSGAYTCVESTCTSTSSGALPLEIWTSTSYVMDGNVYELAPN